MPEVDGLQTEISPENRTAPPRETVHVIEELRTTGQRPMAIFYIAIYMAMFYIATRNIEHACRVRIIAPETTMRRVRLGNYELPICNLTTAKETVRWFSEPGTSDSQASDASIRAVYWWQPLGSSKICRYKLCLSLCLYVTVDTNYL